MHPPLWLCAALASIASASLGQILLKLGVRHLTVQGVALGDPAHFVLVLGQPLLLGGTAAFAASMILWIVAIQGQQLSYVYPLAAIGYVLVTLLSVVIFGDSINSWKVCGILLIVLGVGVLNAGRAAIPTSVAEHLR